MGTEFPGTLDIRSIFAVEIVDGADVVKATTGDEVTRGRVGASHDPAGPQWDSMDFVCRVGIPDDEFAVLGRRDEMSAVGGPMHSINLCKMSPEGASRAHNNPRKSVDFRSHRTHCVEAPGTRLVGGGLS